MDDVGVHKVDGIEEAIEARGAIPFYIAAYSPDLNPIEQLFAKLKALLRKVAAYTLKDAAFTVASLCKTVASCLDQISRAECAAYLAVPPRAACIAFCRLAEAGQAGQMTRMRVISRVGLSRGLGPVRDQSCRCATASDRPLPHGRGARSPYRTFPQILHGVNGGAHAFTLLLRQGRA